MASPLAVLLLVAGHGRGGLYQMFKSMLSVHKTVFKIISLRLSLRIMTIAPVCENVETSQGVPLTVTGVAQVGVTECNQNRICKHHVRLRS